MRTLSGSLTTAYGLVVQKPVWLVQIDLNTPIYLTSGATVTWNSQTWTAEDVDVAGLRVDALKISGSVVLGNTDTTYSQVAIGEGFADKRVRIWGYDGNIAAPALGDPVLVCDAVGAGCEIGEDKLRLSLRDACEYRLGPRAIVAPEFGFNQLLPAGRTLTINGISFVIERGR